MASKEEFDGQLASFRKQKMDFKVTWSGSFRYISYGNRQIEFVPKDFGGIKGAHLSQLVRKDIDKYLPVIPDGAVYTEPPVTVYVNIKNLDECLANKTSLIQIDINRCYWKTIFNLGYISEKTYELGLGRKEWKQGCNAAIGGLDKRTQVDEYKDGKLFSSERYYNPANWRYARLKVLLTVDEVAKDVIYNIIPDEFVMFLVDCFVIKPSALQKLLAYLEKSGYSGKQATITLKRHDPKGRVVVWDKTENKGVINGKNSIHKDLNKFIHYTESGTIK